MINYYIDYYKLEGTWVDEGTLIFDTASERTDNINNLTEDGYLISDIYEAEDCYCSARSWGECGCGNFKD